MQSTQEIISSLSSNKAIFKQLFQTPNQSLRNWRPSPEKWSFQEILCHMLDEEVFDFKARVRHCLDCPDEPMPPIDPEGWVQSKNYNEWDYDKTLNRFLRERTKSIKWLQMLENPNWESVHLHPKHGAKTARFFLYNWLAHDYLHFQQITRYRIAFFKGNTDISLNYAGG